MTDQDEMPAYFVLNPLTTNKTLSKFIFGDKFFGVRYYPNWVHGKEEFSEEKINDFIKKFFHYWVAETSKN